MDAWETVAETQGVRVPVEQLRENLVEALRTIFDPEIPVNVYDLGLIYELDVDDGGRVVVKMTLTAPGCPVAQEQLPGRSRSKALCGARCERGHRRTGLGSAVGARGAHDRGSKRQLGFL